MAARLLAGRGESGRVEDVRDALIRRPRTFSCCELSVGIDTLQLARRTLGVKVIGTCTLSVLMGYERSRATGVTIAIMLRRVNRMDRDRDRRDNPMPLREDSIEDRGKPRSTIIPRKACGGRSKGHRSFHESDFDRNECYPYGP